MNSFLEITLILFLPLFIALFIAGFSNIFSKKKALHIQGVLDSRKIKHKIEEIYGNKNVLNISTNELYRYVKAYIRKEKFRRSAFKFMSLGIIIFYIFVYIFFDSMYKNVFLAIICLATLYLFFEFIQDFIEKKIISSDDEIDEFVRKELYSFCNECGFLNRNSDDIFNN